MPINTTKKFLDQAGVSTLWSRIAEEIAKVDEKVVKNAGDIADHAGKISTIEGKIAALEAGTYDDSEVRGLISANASAIEANGNAITLLNGDAETVGSVANTASTVAATKIAEIVAGANADFDTLKEIADWIMNDTTGAADMANDIAALQGLVGSESVATQIANAISAEGLDKYALASDLNDLADRVKALEDAGYLNETAVNAAIDSKITALNLSNSYDAKGAAAAAETAAKAYADGLASNYEVSGAAASALTEAKAYSDSNLGTAKAYSDANLITAKNHSDSNLATAKTYTDTAFGNIQSLTTAEIEAAITSASTQG